LNNNCNCEHIRGIDCSVENCKYNEKGHYCTASEIHVGPGCASCSSDTVCATFKPEK